MTSSISLCALARTSGCKTIARTKLCKVLFVYSGVSEEYGARQANDLPCPFRLTMVYNIVE